MSARPGTVRRDLFTESYAQNAHAIAEGATLLHGFAAGAAPSLLQAIEDVVAAAPLRHMPRRKLSGFDGAVPRWPVDISTLSVSLLPRAVVIALSFL